MKSSMAIGGIEIYGFAKNQQNEMKLYSTTRSLSNSFDKVYRL